MKTPRKINIFRLDLSTEDPVSEKPFADASFYLNKTHFFEIRSARPKNVFREKIQGTAQRLRKQNSDFIISKTTCFFERNKMAHLCGEIRANFRSQKQDALLNATTSWPTKIENAFRRPWRKSAGKGRHGLVRHGTATTDTAKPTWLAQ
jgi:hypothetical protein